MIDPVLSKNSTDLYFESTSDSRIDLPSSAMIETKHSTEPLGAFDGVRSRFGTIWEIWTEKSDAAPLLINGLKIPRANAHPGSSPGSGTNENPATRITRSG